jgi:predicted regulator of Ras-like GTPase activity (Roadblock/LC7/MglB family)
MMFREPLEAILEHTEGSLGVLLMGMDGIAVEKALKPEGREANLDVAAAEMSSLVRSTQRIGRNIGLGDTQELTLSLENVKFVVRLVGDEYFIVLALTAEGNLGRARYELHKAELALAQEFNF